MATNIRKQASNKNYHKRPKKPFYIDKKSVHQKDITIINIHTPNSKSPKSMKQTLTKQNHNKVADLSTQLAIMDRQNMRPKE